MTTINTATSVLNSYSLEDLLKIKAAACQHAEDTATQFITANGEGGYCGFAWVTIHGIKGNTVLGKRMKAAGFERDWTGKAYQVWNPSGLGTQCMSTKEAGAYAAVEVFRAAGFTAYAGSRAD
jgi:hypothetical protein